MAGKCRYCQEPLPEDRTRRRLYCSDAHKAAFHKKLKAAQKAGGDAKVVSVPEAVKQFKALAYENLQDEVREVLREEIRDTIGQHVRDNVLGAAEVMTHMLPKALAGLRDDLESEDWMIRSRAQAMLLKYVMPLGQEKKDEDKATSITIVHGVPVPDTPLGRAYAGEVRAIEGKAEEIEPFEVDWPECHYCHMRKHPDNMREESAGASGRTRMVCSSCQIRNHYKKGRADPTAIVERV